MKRKTNWNKIRMSSVSKMRTWECVKWNSCLINMCMRARASTRLKSEYPSAREQPIDRQFTFHRDAGFFLLFLSKMVNGWWRFYLSAHCSFVFRVSFSKRASLLHLRFKQCTQMTNTKTMVAIYAVYEYGC